MRALRGVLAIPLLFVVSVTSAIGSGVRDKAGLFSPQAVQKADAELSRIERETNVPVTIETIPSLKGQSIDSVLEQIGKADGIKGLFVLISVNDHKVQAGASKEYDSHFNRPRYQAIYESFMPEFKNNAFDAGLATGVAKIDTTLQSIKTEAGGTITPTKPSQAIQPTRRNGQAQGPIAGKSGLSPVVTIVLMVVGLLAVMFVFRMISALFSAGRGQGGYNPGQMRGPGGPGYGAPGYGGGGGGGGFMSSLFGGIGGAMAGNWIYDQFSGRRHESQGYSNPLNPDAGAPPDNGGDWGNTGGDGGGNWGGGGGDTGGGGGDWGGGGGDTGGGGGDWGGGGGGGDWGGGGGDGGSW